MIHLAVSWSDPDNAYSDAMEPVFEQALVARYGFNQLEITAIGCTRQSEANRKGRWGILTNNKDRVVTFNVGEDGNIPQPGYVIAVADRNLSGRDLGGRISAVNGRVLTLDRAPDASVTGLTCRAAPPRHSTSPGFMPGATWCAFAQSMLQKSRPDGAIQKRKR